MYPCCNARRLISLSFVVFHFSIQFGHAENIDPDDAILQISSHEGKIRSISFRCDVKSGVFESRESPTSMSVEDAEKSSSVVRWDFERNRYFARIHAIQRAILGGNSPDGVQAYYSSVAEFCNDGESFRNWRRGKVVVGEQPTVPDESTALDQSGRLGFVAAAAEEVTRLQGLGFVGIHGMQVGLCWIPTYTRSSLDPPQRLSEFLRRKLDGGDNIVVTSDESGQWLIHLKSYKSSRVPYDWELLYDPVLGRAVRVEWDTGSLDDATHWSPSTRIAYSYDSDTDLCPQNVVMVEMRGDPRGYSWAYREVTINPEVHDSDFRIDFPDGIEVTDHIAKSTYITGVSAADDESAVSRFMDREGLRPATPIQPQKGFGCWFFLANVAGIAIVIGILTWRHFRRSVIGVAVFVSLASNGMSQNLPSHNAHESDQVTSTPVYVRQCGLLSTLFILKYFQIEYTNEVLRSALIPTKEGIGLPDIVTVLNAYGLDTRLRQRVSVRDVNQMLDRGMLALIPIVLKNGRGHYLVAVKHPRTGENVIVDVLTNIEMTAGTNVGRVDLEDSGRTPCSTLELTNIKSIPDGLRFVQSTEEGRIHIGIESVAKSPPRVYLVRCEVNRSLPTTTDVLTFSVRVR